VDGVRFAGVGRGLGFVLDCENQLDCAAGGARLAFAVCVIATFRLIGLTGLAGRWGRLDGEGW